MTASPRSVTLPAVRPLAVERSSEEGSELLVVEGEIDIATSSRLIAALNEAVTEAMHSLVVDLSAVDFMDSTGLALLLGAYRRMRRRGLGFAVVCPGGPVRRVFEVTDMVKTLRVEPTRAEALQAAAAGAPA
jgi:anti-anti-sigma factor